MSACSIIRGMVDGTSIPENHCPVGIFPLFLKSFLAIIKNFAWMRLHSIQCWGAKVHKINSVSKSNCLLLKCVSLSFMYDNFMHEFLSNKSHKLFWGYFVISILSFYIKLYTTTHNIANVPF